MQHTHTRARTWRIKYVEILSAVVPRVDGAVPPPPPRPVLANAARVHHSPGAPLAAVNVFTIAAAGWGLQAADGPARAHPHNRRSVVAGYVIRAPRVRRSVFPQRAHPATVRCILQLYRVGFLCPLADCFSRRVSSSSACVCVCKYFFRAETATTLLRGKTVLFYFSFPRTSRK